METARQWLTTLSLAALAIGVLTLAFTPASATAETPAGFSECFFLNAGAYAGRKPDLVVPISKLQDGALSATTFSTRGYQPVTSVGDEILMCR